MSKILVVYATKSGCTTGVAEKIAETLTAAGAQVDVAAAKEAGPAAGYDAVVVGSGVRAGQWHAAARTWVADNAEALKAVPVAFYTCGLAITDPEKADEVYAYTKPLVEQTGVEPVAVGLFAGWNEPDAFPFAERLILKLMKAPQGDFRDLGAVAAWAQQVAPELGLSA